MPKEAKGITLTFEGDRVKGVWYHPKLGPVLCSLCEKEPTCKEKDAKPGDGTVRRCLNANPYCG